MKTVLIPFLFLAFSGHAQVSGKYLVFNESNKTFTSAVGNDEVIVNSLSSLSGKQLNDYWKRPSCNCIDSSLFTIVDFSFDSKVASKVLLTTSNTNSISLGINISQASQFDDASKWSDNLPKPAVDLNTVAFRRQNEISLTGSTNFLCDSSFLRFSHISTINEPIYYDGKIMSFQLKQSLVDEKGVSLALRTVFATPTFSSLVSAGPNNGAKIEERSIYESLVFGSDSIAYYTLKSPSVSEGVSLTLNPVANWSGNNQQGSFRIVSGGNTFSVGTLSSSMAFVGFDKIAGTTLNLQASTITEHGQFIEDGVVRSSALAVSDDNFNTPTTNEYTVAYFGSRNPHGSQIEISNSSLSPDALTGIIFRQGNHSSTIFNYSENSTNPFLSGSMAFETNASNGITFSTNGFNNIEPGEINFLIGNKKILTIKEQTVTIAKIMALEPMSEDEIISERPTMMSHSFMLDAAINQPIYFDGNDFYKFKLEKIELKSSVKTKSL